MELFECIEKRRSVRSFSEETVSSEAVGRMLSAGLAAPSGKNGQPWRFVVVQRDRALLEALADLTIYRNFVSRAACLIVVFLDKTRSYHYIKDVQAVGACIQNMLLAATDMGLGCCWIGEILNRDGKVKDLLGIDHRLDLMAVLAVGHPLGESDAPAKRSLEDCVLAYR